MADRWSGPVGRLGVETPDGRLIERDGFYTRSLPLPLDWQEKTGYGHDDAVTVGTIDTIDVQDDGTIMGGGEWLDEAVIPEVGRARMLVDKGVVYPSVQAAACEIEYAVLGGGAGDYVDGEFEEGAPYREVCVFKTFELSKVTLVAEQAMPDLRITTDSGSMALVAAGVRSTGWDSLPVADTDTAWDGTGAADRVAAWAGVDETDAGQDAWDKYARAFLWQDPEADPMTKGAYGLGVADVINGELTLIPRGVYAVAGVLNGARGGADIPESDQTRLKTVVTGLYEKIASAADDDSIVAPFALVASAAEPEFRLPPRAWFDDPGMTEHTPLTITPEGRVYGLLAPWDFPHIGLPDATAPRSATGYAYFHVGATMTDAGEVATGKLTVGGGHADVKYGYSATTDHYDNVCTAVATVRAGENEFGIWVAGAIIADATPNQVEALRQSPLSGDWRDIGGNLELVAAHAVNVPGFPVPRARALVASSGRVFSLVAAAQPGPRKDVPVPAPIVAPEYVRELAVELAAQLRPEGALDGRRPVSWMSTAPADFDAGAADLRAEFARVGTPWPSIAMAVGGRELPPFEVAEGCVRGMLAPMIAPEGQPESEPAVLPQAAALALAEAKLRMAGVKGGR